MACGSHDAAGSATTSARSWTTTDVAVNAIANRANRKAVYGQKDAPLVVANRNREVAVDLGGSGGTVLLECGDPCRACAMAGGRVCELGVGELVRTRDERVARHSEAYSARRRRGDVPRIGGGVVRGGH